MRSLRQNFNSLCLNLEAFAHPPDIVFVTEIWIYSYEVNDYHIPGYNFFANTNDSYSAGGVGVFVRNIYEYDVTRFCLASADILKLNLNTKKELISFVCVYRLHSKSLQVFQEEFSSVLDRKPQRI